MSAIRVLVGVLGMDQHEVGAVAIAKTLRDEGMEVIYAGCFNTPQTMVRSAIEEDVDVIGVSSHSWEYLYYMPELIELLKENDVDIPVVLGGSVITEEDAATMRAKGVAAVFGSGSMMADVVASIRNLVAGEVAR